VKIKEMFQKDINRPINGVVKADQDDEATIFQELDEYVITKELDKHFRTFFDSYVKDPLDAVKTNNIGVWVSGFFGSGKSHFIKILSYILENRTVKNHDGEEKDALDFFNEDKVKDAFLRTNIEKSAKTPTDVILFNIDSKNTNQEEVDSISNVFLKVFNELRGFSPHYQHVAYLEKTLFDKGKYQEFKDNFYELNGKNWEEERDKFYFIYNDVVRSMVQTLEIDEFAAKDWIKNAESDFQQMFNIENFARWVKEYLDSKSPDQRIVFLVDEAGQFIGQDTHRMLSLQTIAENFGTICEGRAWIVVTSQEEIDSVVSGLEGSRRYDFSKIQDRFRTRISLSGSNTDEVIQARLLSKKEEAVNVLENLFKAKGDIIQNQVSFDDTGAVIKNFVDEKSFVDVYPFIPYQFNLIQKIFESIRKAGATGSHLSHGERSMLDAFQSAAKQSCEKDEGILVPLYDFYPTIENFIDTPVKRAIDKTNEDDYLDDFDSKLLKALFLIRYIDTIKGTVENLSTLCLSEIDQDKIALKQKITNSLQKLERQNYVTRIGDIYKFLTKAEQDVTRGIREITISSPEENQVLSSKIFGDVLGGKSKYRYPHNRKDYDVLRILDGNFIDSPSSYDLRMEIITQSNDNYSVYTKTHCMGESLKDGGMIIIKFPEDRELFDDINTYLKTDSYVKRYGNENDPEYQKILLEKRNENRSREERIKQGLEKLFLDAEFYAFNADLDPKSSTPGGIFDELCAFLLENTYNKLTYITHTYDNPLEEMSKILNVDDLTQMGLDIESHPNSLAIKEIDDFIRIRSSEIGNIIVQDLIDKFSKSPFGWRDGEILVCLAILKVAGKITFSSTVSKSNLNSKEAVEYLSKTNKRKEISVVKKKQTEEKMLQEAQNISMEIFGERGPSTEKELYEFLKDKVENIRDNLNRYKQIAETGNYPGLNEIKSGIDLINRLLRDDESYDFFKLFTEKKETCMDMEENYQDLQGFYENQIAVWQRLQSALSRFNMSRVHLDNDNEAREALQKMESIINDSAPYSKIKDIESLINTVENRHQVILSDMREKAISIVDSKLDMLREDVDDFGLNNDESNRVMRPLQQLKERISSEISTANIASLQMEIDKTYENSYLEAEEIYNKNNYVQATPESTPVKDSREDVSITKYFPPAMKFLNDEDDLDDFISSLRRRLLEDIHNNKRIRLR